MWFFVSHILTTIRYKNILEIYLFVYNFLSSKVFERMLFFENNFGRQNKNMKPKI